MEDKIKAIEAMQDTLKNCKDPYNIGLYNGLELALTVLQDRNPIIKKLPIREDSAKGVLNEETGGWDALS